MAKHARTARKHVKKASSPVKKGEQLADRCKFDIPSLDEALGGGLPRGSCTLISGGSGVGKTILCMEWLFNGYKRLGEPGVYITTTEPIFKAINHMKNLQFFDSDSIGPGSVHLTDLRSVMSDLNIDLSKDVLVWQDIESVLDVIKRLVEGSNAKRLALDSITAICYRLKDENVIRTFIFRLGTMLSNLNCTILLTSEVPHTSDQYSAFGVEEFISDGIIKLGIEDRGESTVRFIKLVKVRGIMFDSSPIYYRITNQGITILPRIEFSRVEEAPLKRIKSGIKGLDEMLGGGFFAGTTSLINGASGTGKSLFGVQFLLAGLKDNNRCLLINYEEEKPQIFRNVRNCLGIDLESLEKKGLIRIVCAFPEHLIYEEHLLMIRGEVEKFRPNRFVLDSLSSLEKAFPKQQIVEFTRRINSVLKSRGITSVLVNASGGMMEASAITESHLSTIPDNIILLKYVEIESVMRRFITVLKVRGSNHDKQLREYVIQKGGINVKGAFKGMQGIFSGNVHTSMESTKLLKVFKELSTGE